MLRQEEGSVTGLAVNYEIVDRATMLQCKYSKSVDGSWCNPNVEDIWHIKDDVDGLFHEPDWTLDAMWAVIRENVRISVWSAFDSIKTAYAAGGIKAPTDIRAMPLLTRIDVKATVNWRSIDSARASALSENGDALHRDEATLAERNDAPQRVEALRASLSANDT